MNGIKVPFTSAWMAASPVCSESSIEQRSLLFRYLADCISAFPAATAKYCQRDGCEKG